METVEGKYLPVVVKFFYEPGNRISIKLSLRRTLVRSYHCSAKNKPYKSATQQAMPQALQLDS